MKKILKIISLGLAATILAGCSNVPKGEIRNNPK